MTSNLDEMYDEMLRGEFRSRGKHAAPDTAEPPAARRRGRTPCTSPRRTLRFTTSSRCRRRRRLLPWRRPRRARGRGGSRATATPPWWGPVGWPAPRWAPFSAASVAPSPSARRRPTRWRRRPHRTNRPPPPSRRRTARDRRAAPPRLTTAALSSLSGSLTQGVAPLQWLTSQTGSVPATLADLSSAGTSAGSGSGAGAGRVRDRDSAQESAARPRRPTSGSAASSAV